MVVGPYPTKQMAIPKKEDESPKERKHLERRLPVSGLERDPGCHPFASLKGKL